MTDVGALFTSLGRLLWLASARRARWFSTFNELYTMRDDCFPPRGFGMAGRL